MHSETNAAQDAASSAQSSSIRVAAAPAGLSLVEQPPSDVASMAHSSPAAFALAPFGPVLAMAQRSSQAWGQLWLSQARLAMAGLRTATDMWRLAYRRQQDALWPPTRLASAHAEPPEASTLSADAHELNAAADAVRSASLELARTQAAALERLRLSA